MSIAELDDQITTSILGLERVLSGSVFMGAEPESYIDGELTRVKLLQLELVGAMYGLRGVIGSAEKPS